MAILKKIFSSEEHLASDKSTELKIKLLEAYHPYKLTQRFIAISVIFVYILILLSGVLSSLFGIIDITKVNAAKDFANELWLNEIVIVIVGFYFGGGFIESVNRKRYKGEFNE